ncbi:ABC transporter substrate-binding protein [Streptomyces sp. NPDC059618]|uniref:ABC transporter substrate-binding protein n=1 Tax=Streptomyces sp. NPDC059618 TaxID=3346887 RepID=UPI0036A19983
MSIAERFAGMGRLTRALVLVTAVAVVVAAVWGGWTVTRPDLTCAEGVHKRTPDGECTGVTDGAFSYAPWLDEVSARIKTENDAVDGRPHVTVAVMVPMTGFTKAVDTDRILRQVQGAYLAQYHANHDESEAPKIRLVLANPGSDSFDWPRVTGQLARMAASSGDNLRAVTGFDRSVPATKDTIAHLTRDLHIPVVGGAITADDLANDKQAPGRYPGLVRTVPTNTGEADALAAYPGRDRAEKAVVVEDSRDDDNYISTLKHAFERITTSSARHTPETFTSPADIADTGNTSNVFDIVIQNICQSDADTIYFAGRYTQLQQFINGLGKRGCSRPFTLVTGSEANALLSDSDLKWTALKKKVTVRYVSLAHPDMWTGKRVDGGAAKDVKQLVTLVDLASRGPVGPIGPTDLTDSRTMVMYDTVWTAVQGIRLSFSGNHPADRPETVPSIADVAGTWQLIHSAHKVEGAGGWICLDSHGNPYDKALAVVELEPDSRTARFVALAWPNRKPPEADCTAPNGT